MHTPHDRVSHLLRHEALATDCRSSRGFSWSLASQVRTVFSFRLDGGNGGCMSAPSLPLHVSSAPRSLAPPSALSGAKRGGRCHVPRAVCHPPGGCSRAPSYGKRALLPSLPPSHGARVGTGTWELMPGSSAPPDLSRIDRLSCLLARPTSVRENFEKKMRTHQTTTKVALAGGIRRD